MGSPLRSGLVLFVLLSLVTGLAYPALVTLVAQLAFPHEANGSLIVRNGHALGSELIGQPFTDVRYFWGRPSATSPTPTTQRLPPLPTSGPRTRAGRGGAARLAAIERHMAVRSSPYPQIWSPPRPAASTPTSAPPQPNIRWREWPEHAVGQRFARAARSRLHRRANAGTAGRTKGQRVEPESGVGRRGPA